MIDSRAFVVLAVLGAVVGLFLAEVDVAVLGLVAGAATVYLLVLVMRLQRRVDELEQEARRQRFLGAAAAAAERAPPVEPAAARPGPPAPLAEAAGWEAGRPGAAAGRPQAGVLPPEPTVEPVVAPSAIDTALAAARTWLTTGNVPVKIGVIVSFFGVAFLLKYAVDRKLLVFPIELRLLAVAAAAVALLVIGWRLRERTRVYALSLQGGGIGILYLTIFAALRLYALLPPVLAFGLLFVLAVAGGALAVLQNARGLAALGAVGGFLAPILVSTGTGSHVVLFTYYLVLNALIVGIAWFKPWRELNLLGFAFTFVIGGLWGYRNFTPDMLGSTEPFVVLFFLFYQATAILFALRQPPDLRGLVDGTLVFGTPVVAFALQAVLLRDTEYGLAFSALGAALFYVTAATWLHRVQPQALRLLIEAFLALAVAFGTLAIPLALDARWTSAAWALEGAALVWIGTRQGRPLARAAGVALVVAAGIAFLDYGWQHGRGPPVLNGNLLGGWLIALAGFFVTRQLERSPGRFAMLEAWVGRSVFVASALWWLGAGVGEIGDRLPWRQEFGAVVLLLAVSAVLSSLVAARLDWMLARRAAFAALPLLALPAAASALAGSHPGASLGALAWPVAILLQYWLLRRDEACLGRLLSFGHALLAGLATALLMWEVHWQARHGGLSQVWALSLAAAIPGGLLLAVLQLRGRLGWPLAAHGTAYLVWVCGVLFAWQALPVVHLNLGTNGAATPLAYVPLVNPVDLVTAFALLCALSWLQALSGLEGLLSASARRTVLAGLGAAAFAASTLALLRAVHHLGGVPWQWYSLSSSVLVQAALSVYWGLLGFVAMVAGARGARRWLWLTGAALMGVVVAKLFLVDLGNTGTVARIVSFIATGALLLVVGYLAPAPPRRAEDRNA